MSTFDHKSSALDKTQSARSEPEQPKLRFADVLKAVDGAAGLTVRVRQNMRTAVTRTATLMSPLGLHGPVEVQSIGKKLDKLAPAQLGFQTDASLASYKSNLRRALSLAGLTIMPGRHVTPLSLQWRELLDRVPDSVTGDGEPRTNSIRIRLSRFAHVASERDWAPEAVGPHHLDRFGELLCETCLGSKCTRVVRETAAAWAEAQSKIPGWPANDLGNPERQEHGYALAWTDFPDSFRADVEAFVARDDLDDADEDCHRPLKPLRDSTKDNYRQTCRRAASILVRLGTPPEGIKILKDLITLPNVQRICSFLGQRNARAEGGAPFYTALVLFIAAKHHLYLPERELKRLERYWKKIRGRYGEMSGRTFKRLQQFDDPRAVQAMARLPAILLKAAKKMGEPSTASAKLFRTALFISLAQDTALRAGNLVKIDVHKHLSLTHRRGQTPIADLVIPAVEVKNEIEIPTRLTDETVKLLQLWLSDYRCTQLAINCNSSWLFPNTKGGHRSVSQALEDVKDLSARYAGLDVTPHLMRAFVGKVILDEQPDGHATVQQILGHKSLKTTVTYYAPVRPAQARARYHRSLSRHRGVK